MDGRSVSLQIGFWVDPDFGGMSPGARLYYLWLWTCEHAHGVTGIGEASLTVQMAETGMTEEEIERARTELAGKVRWFDKHRWWVVGRARRTCYTKAGSRATSWRVARASFFSRCGRTNARRFWRCTLTWLQAAVCPNPRPQASPGTPWENAAPARRATQRGAARRRGSGIAGSWRPWWRRVPLDGATRSCSGRRH